MSSDEKKIEEYIHWLSCDAQKVCPEIHFGTAGYRPLHEKSILKDCLFLYRDKIVASESELDLLERKVKLIDKDPSEEEVNEHVVALLAMAVSSLLTVESYQQVGRIIVNFDVRFKGIEYAEIMAAVWDLLVQNSCIEEVILLDRYVSTPELSWYMKYQEKDAIALHITASHNPLWFTGFKFEWIGGVPISDLIASKIQKYYHGSYQEVLKSEGYMVGHAMRSRVVDRDLILYDYFDFVCEEIKFIFPNTTVEWLYDAFKNSEYKILYDPNWGEGIAFWEMWCSRIVRDACTALVVHTEYGGDPEGTFSFYKPEPSLRYLQRPDLEEQDVDYVIANDPDADRVTVIEKSEDGWREWSMNDLVLFWCYEILQNIRLGLVEWNQLTIVTTLASKTLPLYFLEFYQEEFEKASIQLRCVSSLPVGFKWFSCAPETEMTREGENFLELKNDRHKVIVYEESGGVSTGLSEKDGLLGGALISTLILKYGRLSQLYQNIIDDLGFDCYYNKDSVMYKLSCSSLKTYDVYDFLKANSTYQAWQYFLKTYSFNIDRMTFDDGCKIYLTPDSHLDWIVVRLSGTEPKARVYLQLHSKWLKSFQDGDAFLHDICLFVQKLIEGIPPKN